MSYYKKILLLPLLCLYAGFIDAQSDSAISTSICIQNAYTFDHLLDARVLIEELGANEEVLSLDSMNSTIFISKKFEPNHNYKISVSKEGFYPTDTVITPKVSSVSRKQRLGISLRPIVCYYVRGKVSNTVNNQKIKQGTIRIKNLTTDKLVESQINNGYYEFCGQCAHQYEISTLVDGHIKKSEVIELASNNCFTPNEQEIKLDLEIAESYDDALFNGDSVTIHEFTFVGKTVNLSAEGQKELDKLIQVMKLMPDLILSIAVHTDPSKSHRFNRLLSEKRALLLEEKLTAEGIAKERFELISKGEEEAIFPDASKNQRACLWLRKKDE